MRIGSEGETPDEALHACLALYPEAQHVCFTSSPSLMMVSPIFTSSTYMTWKSEEDVLRMMRANGGVFAFT